MSGQLDVGRFGEALARPGMDPRVWASLAVVDDFVVDADGVWVDVTLIPSQTKECARVGAIYAGAGFGIYAPLQKDDEVLVVAPGGEPDEGLVVVSRLWSSSDVPPTSAQAAANVADVVIVVESGKHLRIETGGTGNTIIEPKGTGVVEVGGTVTSSPPAAMEPMILGQKLAALIAQLVAVIDGHVHTTSGGPSGAAEFPPAMLTPAAATVTPLVATTLATKGRVV